jgi:thiamine biosynthesis lipoprotein
MKAILTAIVIGLWAARCSAAGEEQRRFEYTEPHMGTRFRIVLYAADEATANRAAKAAFARIAELDGIMSDYRATSELMQLCAKAGGDPIKVSDDLFTVLEKAQEISRLSDGAFDVSVGPVVKLWRIARRTQKLPEKEQLDKALALVGYRNIKLDSKNRTVQLVKTGMLLDLGGIAKGYAADCTLAVLTKQGIDRALVAAGGDIAVSGPPPDAEGWKIGIQPVEGGEPRKYLMLKEAAVSTSGDFEQYVIIDGKRYSHIVDPKTGLGLVGRMSVTVVAKNGLNSDPLAKVPCVLGPEKGLGIIDSLDGVSALMVRKTDKGEEVIESKRFKELKSSREP